MTDQLGRDIKFIYVEEEKEEEEHECGMGKMGTIFK